jgi:predicted aspartyl protease
MDEIRVRMNLENESDHYLWTQRKLRRNRVRKAQVDAVVDTGAVMMLLPPELVEKLGLRRWGKVLVRLAHDQKIELEKAGAIHLTIGDREMSASCLIGPPGCEPLVGQLVMEELDLIPDPNLRTPTPRPESPFLPTLKMKPLRFGSFGNHLA